MKRRWSDNQKQFGPFTYARDGRGYRPLGITLDSGEGESPGCHLRLRGFGHTLIIELPPIIRPYRHKVFARSWDLATVVRMGRDWYWDEYPREYGFMLSDGFLNVSLGRRTMDSSTDQQWGYFLPWTQWRFVRYSLYDIEGKHCWTEDNRKDWKERHAAKDACPSASFEFEDFDGERITAKTKIEEWEWRFGEGWFKWLSLFRKPKVSRTLDIEFSAETGRRKGSWKGGTVGHSIELHPGELHESGFRRYCENHNMAFIGTAG